jgi:hypothetical protein
MLLGYQLCINSHSFVLYVQYFWGEIPENPLVSKRDVTEITVPVVPTVVDQRIHSVNDSAVTDLVNK